MKIMYSDGGGLPDTIAVCISDKGASGKKPLNTVTEDKESAKAC